MKGYTIRDFLEENRCHREIEIKVGYDWFKVIILVLILIVLKWFRFGWEKWILAKVWCYFKKPKKLGWFNTHRPLPF